MGKHKIDDLFAAKFRHREQAPTAHAWESINRQLTAKARRQWWTRVSVAASFALLVATAWYAFTPLPDTGYTYSYAPSDTGKITIPAEIILVPVIVAVPSGNGNEITTARPAASGPAATTAEPAEQPPPARNSILQPKLAPVIKEPLPVEQRTDEPLMATAGEPPAEKKPLPVTIIYKQGEPAEKSNLTKAITYLAEVRTGEKKLFDLQKIRNNLKRKKKAKATNSK